MGAAELALSTRVRGLKREHVRHALWEERALVKTWTIRGTLHLHPADELPLWTAAVRAVEPPWYEAYGLTAKQGEKDRLKAAAMAEPAVQKLLDVFPADIRDVEEVKE